MRGFTKAVAFVSSAFASAFVVPVTSSSEDGVKASDPFVQYSTSSYLETADATYKLIDLKLLRRHFFRSILTP